ncbi:hypothetical protein [Nitrosophilus labii]|uniref:hypothetical protein n=1 Tax=Nitrosophilus labii TaxID=2706014 RepID=UPI001656CF00|nr:hypothetical protein [Nitrosophilus labii]
MKRTVFKEIGVYLAIFFILSLGIHYKEWFSYPIEHLSALPKSQFGVLHPFLFSFGIYLFVLIVRLFIKVIKRAIAKGSKKI